MTNNSDVQPDWFEDSAGYHELARAKRAGRRESDARELDQAEDVLKNLEGPYTLETTGQLLEQHELLHDHWLRCVNNLVHLKNDQAEMHSDRARANTPEEVAEWQESFGELMNALERVKAYQDVLLWRIHGLKVRKAELSE